MTRGALGRAGRALAAAPLRPVALALAGLLVALAGLGVTSDRLVGRVVAQRVADELANTLATAVAGLEGWLAETQRLALAATEDDRVTAAARQGEGLAEALAPYLRGGSFSGFALFGPGAEALVSGGSLAGVRAPGPAPRAIGAPAFVPPVEVAPGRALPLVRAHIAAEGGPLTLVLAIPLDHFTAVLHFARAGRSGETYAVDGDGRMLSETRFAPQLRAAGLLAPGASAVLAVAVRDPGVDLTSGDHARLPRAEQPLTRMAASLVRGGAGVDVRGYRDYRGVEVVGAWRWLAHGFGVVTEIDRAEAFHSLATLERLFTGLLLLVGLSSAALVLLGLVTRRLEARARAAERQIAALGQYKIERKLGEGGMGSVYLGTHALLRRPTAIKLLRPDGVGSAARFEREVRATSELRHPNTIAIYDYGRTPDGILYYAMEYLEGASMETLVRTHGPLPAERVIYLMRQACGSLAEAHARGVIHRDVKPANIWVCHTRGVADLVKVLDFGLARWQREPDPGAPAGVRGYELDLVLGTPAYMAPERFESANAAGPQSDVYALGAVAYFLCTGTPVFTDHSLAALSAAHLSRVPVPPAQRLGRALDRALEHAILSCLAKDPDRRPAGPAALAWLLDASPLARAWSSADAEDWWRDRARTPVAPAPPAPPATPDLGSPPLALPGHA